MVHPVVRRRLRGAGLGSLLVLAGQAALAATLAADLALPASEAAAVAPPVPVPPARAPRPAGPGRLRLATFNVAWFTGSTDVGFVPRSAKDITRVARIMRGTHAHLVCLQEVLDEGALERVTREMNRLARGQARFSYRSSEGEPILSPPGERAMNQRIGLVYDAEVLEIREARFLEELTGEGGLIRAPLWARVAVRGTPLDFDLISVHLKAGMMDERAREVRTREVGRLVAWIRSEREGADPDLVLMGDFNAARDDETLQELDDAADAGELIAIEDQIMNGPVGTHIPWEVGIDRAFMTESLWKKAGLRGGASIYRFDDFMPRAHEVDDFCIRTKTRLRKKSLRCACEASEDTPEGSDEQMVGRCGDSPLRWAKAANYLRVSDHRPLLWDLRRPRQRFRGKPSRRPRRHRLTSRSSH